MRIYHKVFYTGVMPGPHCFIRARLVPCAPRPIALDVKEGLFSSNIHARINRRAGLDIEMRRIGSYGIREGKHNGRSFFWRAYGYDNPLPFKV